MLPARAALLGTLVLTTSIGVFYWGRNGRPELLLCLLMTASMYCFYRALDTVRWSRHAWLFAGWIVMGAAHLAKEFVPVMVVAPLVMYAAWQHTQSNDEQRVRDESLGRLRWAMLALLGGTVVYCALLGVALHSEKLASQALAVNQSTSQPVNRIVPTSLTFAAIWKHVQLPTLAILFGGPVVWYVCQRGSWRRVLSLLPVSLPGAAIMVAMFLPWMLHVQHMFPHVESVLNTEVADRTAGAGRWQDDRPPGFYLFSLVGMVSPWVVLLPGALAAGMMNRFRRNGKGLVFLMLWTVVIVLLFSCAVGKRWHYILPVAPAVCLLMGYMLNDLLFEHRWLSEKLGGVFVTGHAIAAVVAGLALGLVCLCGHSIIAMFNQHHSGNAEIERLKVILATTLLAAMPAMKVIFIVVLLAAISLMAATVAWRGRAP